MAKKKRKRISKKQRRRNIILFISVLMIVVFSILLGIMKASVPEGITTAGSDLKKARVSKPLIINEWLTKNANSRPGIALEKVRGIVIHYTANPGTDAKANRNYFESRKNMKNEKKNKVSSHYIIGLTGDIVQCIPDSEIAYASNGRNHDTLSIECCHPDESGKFSQDTYQSLVHLTAYLVQQYQVPFNQIIRHYDVTGKNCPKYYVENTSAWKQLKEDIRIYLKSRT